MKRRTKAAVSAIAIASLIAVIGSTLAQWRVDGEVSSTLNTNSPVYLSVGRVGQPPTPVQGPDDVVPIRLTEQDAQDAIDNPDGIAIAIVIDGRAPGSNGIDYDLNPDDWTDGTFFDDADVTLFPVDGPDDCTVANAPSSQPPTVDQTLIEPTPTQTSGTSYWCLTVVADEEDGQWSNTGTVVGDGEGQEVTDSDTWTAAVVDVDGGYTVSHELVRPGA